MREKILERLARGEIIENYRELGNSMTPIIKHREPVTLAPVETSKLEKGDIVFAKVHGNFFTHFVGGVEGERIKIQNNHGHVNGWITGASVYAIVIAVNGVPRRGALEKTLKFSARGVVK